ncbi:MAG: hypothetical protein ACKO85_19170 [Isosphaeraceae bacterium]
MRTVHWSRVVAWAMILSWPWLVWLVVKSSPEMVLKGIATDTSAVMPVVADVVLCLGAFYAIQSRKGLILRPSKGTEQIYAGPHFKRISRKPQATQPVK